MPALVSPRFALSIALVGLACGPTNAQLQWESSGVQQASHQAPADRLQRALRKPQRFVKPQATKPQAKAPTAVATTPRPTPPVPHPAKFAQPPKSVAPGDGYAAQRAAHSERVAQQATAILQHAGQAPAPRQTPHQQNQITRACHTCGSASADCQCGPIVDAGFGGCDCGEPTCGVGFEDACGCGEAGCGGACGACSYGGCSERGAVPLILFVPPIRELTFSAGVQGFKNPLDGPDDAVRDRGNFGFNESVSLSGPMSWLPWKSVGYQIGYRSTQSQLHGSSIGSTADSHTQHFLTAGLFRRKPVGLQYGLVYDFFQDERIYRSEFGQLRGLISVTNPKGLEWGFQFATGVKDATLEGAQIGTELFEPVDQYLLFCRKKNPCGAGELRLFGGVTGDSKGVFGGDVDIPLGDRFSFQSGFAYLIPEDEALGVGGEEEQWNLGMNLVWHYGKRAKQSYRSPFRPLFNVADNGSFFVDDSRD